MGKDKNYTLSDFDEYIRQGEPDRRQKARNWQTAIGLQAVDGLHTSDYLHELAGTVQVPYKYRTSMR